MEMGVLTATGLCVAEALVCGACEDCFCGARDPL
jgi:hypothetical protein